MKLRPGRKNPRNLYLQVGDEPGDADPSIGFFIDNDTAALIADGLNSPWHLREILHNAEDRDEGPPEAKLL